MKDPMQNIRIEEIMKLAATPKGQSLLQNLQQEHGAVVQQAMMQAQLGNYEAVQKMLSDLLNSPKGKSLREQLKR